MRSFPHFLIVIHTCIIGYDGHTVLDITIPLRFGLNRSDSSGYSPVASKNNHDGSFRHDVFYSTDTPLVNFMSENFKDIIEEIDSHRWIPGYGSPPKLIISISLKNSTLSREKVPSFGYLEQGGFGYLLTSQQQRKIEENSVLLANRLSAVAIDISGIACGADLKSALDKVNSYKATSFLTNNCHQRNERSSSIKVGVGYTPNHIGCEQLRDELKAGGAEFVILLLEFEPPHFLPSYTMFRWSLNGDVLKNANFLKNNIPTKTTNKVVYRFKMKPSNNNNNNSTSLLQVLRKYQVLLVDFAERWASEMNATIIVDMPYYAATTSDKYGFVDPSSNNSSDNVIEDIFGSLACHLQLGYIRRVNTPFPVLDSVHLIGSTFRHVYVDLDSWTCLSHCLSFPPTSANFNPLMTLCHCGNETLRGSLLPTLDFHVSLSFQELENIDVQLLFLNNCMKPKALSVFPSKDEQVMSLTSKQSGKLDFLRQNGISAGCEFYNGDFKKVTSAGGGLLIRRTPKICQSKLVSVLVWRFTLGLEYLDDMNTHPYDYFSRFILSGLEKINGQRKIWMMKENKSIHFHFVVTRPSFNIKGPYCNNNVLVLNEYIEGIVRWGSLNSVPLIMNSAFESVMDMSWWQTLEIPKGLHQFSTSAYYPVLRNYPETLISGGLRSMDPCFKKTTDIPQSGIKFDPNFTGVTHDLNGSKEGMSSDELSTMLLFMTHKFSKIQLKLQQQHEKAENENAVWEAIRLAQQQYWRTEKGNSSSTKMFIQVDFLSIGNVAFVRQIEEHQEDLLTKTQSGLEIHGIHVSNWENYNSSSSDVKLHNFIDFCARRNVKVGLFVRSCVSMLNLASSKSFQFELLYSKLNYIICMEPDEPPETVTDVQQMARLLDGHLVIRNIFRRYFPGLEVHFQVTWPPPPPLKEDTDIASVKNFLTFTSDINKFAEAYKINYFLCRAFDDNATGELELGWWRIDNWSRDLTNLSVYFERESEYLNKLSWRPTPTPLLTTDTNWRKSLLTRREAGLNIWFCFIGSMGGSLLIFVTLGTTTTLAILRWKRIKQGALLLSKEDVKEFHRGRVVKHNKNLQGGERSGEEAAKYMKYDPKFEIPKRDIQFDFNSILGMGNFGTVCKTMVRGKLVALKFPNDGCSKEAFQSMLTEIKVMIHVGEHEHVVKFLGSNTCDIMQGVVYVATMLCGNGSLQNYLRDTQRTLLRLGERCQDEDPAASIIGVDLRQLITFSKEISAGMQYISEKKVVHGDLSTRNVLLDEHLVCKISDFGLARKLYEYSIYTKASHGPLPWRWMSIETLKSMEFSTKSDVWSYGVTLWEIFSFGDVPYPGQSWTVDFVEKIEDGLRLHKPKFASDYIYQNIMMDCWSIDPGKRPSFAELTRLLVDILSTVYLDLSTKK